MRTLLTALALLTAFVPAPGRAAAPYPRSAVIAGLRWDTSTYQDGGLGGDIWPVTWGADGRLYAAWGDGTLGCPAKVSYGVAALPGTPSAATATTGCGPRGAGKGKIGSLLAVGGTLYAIVNLQNRPWPGPDFEVWASPDRGRSWRRPGWSFPGTGGAIRPVEFVNLGRPGYGGVPWVFLTAERSSARPTEVYLMAVPAARLQDRAAYVYLARASTSPVWSAAPGAAAPVFADRAGVDGPVVTPVYPLSRYLLTAGHGGGGRVGVFEGPTPWGPWRTVEYEQRWLGIACGEYLGLRFPQAWNGSGGALWAVFSCWGLPGCGRYHDRLNVMHATALVARRAGAAATVAGDVTAPDADPVGLMERRLEQALAGALGPPPADVGRR